MNKISEYDLILSQGLSLDLLPSRDADLETLERFCLTIDGYQNGKYSIDQLLDEAERVERAGLENATLGELRVAAFIRQRQLRWSSDGDPAAEPPLIRKIQALVAEIRGRVERGEIAAADRES